jgi:hypothetical protein
MPPHCDSLDGPVVRAARRALDSGDVALVLPFVPASAEKETVEAFESVVQARRPGGACRAVADRHFFETVVRLHRAGEGAAFTGLKPAGLDVGPVIPVAERAIETGAADGLEALLVATVREHLAHRFDRVQHLRPGPGATVEAARAYVQARLGLQVWAHGLYLAAASEPHAAAHEHD